MGCGGNNEVLSDIGSNPIDSCNADDDCDPVLKCCNGMCISRDAGCFIN